MAEVIKPNVIKEIIISENGSEEKGFLIAAPFHNKLANTHGFVLHFTKNIDNYDPTSEPPFCNSILFPSSELALLHGEIIVRCALAHCAAQQGV